METKKLLIYITKCTEVYSDVFKDKLFSSVIQIEGEDTITNFIGFHEGSKTICKIHYENEIKKSFDNDITKTKDHEVLLIHDNFDVSRLPDDVKNYINQFDVIYIFFHTNNDNNQNDILTNIIGKRVFNKSYSHTTQSEDSNWQLNPFYRLQELWECTNTAEFDNKIEEFIKDFFQPKLEIALNLLHRIYNGEVINADTLSLELKKLFETNYNIGVKYDDNNHQNKLIALRDAIIEKELQS